MRAVLPLHLPDINEPEVGLIDQCGRLQGMSGVLVTHMASGDTAKLRVNHWNELLESRFVPIPPRQEEIGDLGR